MAMAVSTICGLFLVVIVCAQASAPGVQFDYSGPRGPSHWAHLADEWKTCGRGRHQSPIDLTKSHIHISSRLGRLQRSYHPSDASLKNKGHAVMVKWTNGAGKIKIDGRNFTLIQCHWHSPSEHTIYGRRYPLEIHMVHQTADNRTAVIGILYEYGRHDLFLAKIRDGLASLRKNMTVGAEEPAGMVDPKQIKRGSRKYFRYMGSLTTPPCTEGVIWIVVDKVRTVGRGQVRSLVNAVHDGAGGNARPIQNINGRIIEMYHPRRTSKRH